MTKSLLCTILLSVITLSASEAFLVSDGKSDYAIVLQEKPTHVEETAAAELQDYLRKMSGARLPVVRNPDYRGKAVRLGQTPVNARLAEVDFSKLKPDEIVLKRVGEDLVLTGDRPRGVLYAVYEFLEDLGVRQWTAWDIDIPKKKNIPLKKYNIRYAPPFLGRDRLGGTNGKFGAWMRVNGHYLNVPESHGGVMPIIGWCHTFGEMIPRETYFKDHPEYFALVNGVRAPVVPGCGREQLCLTNPEVIRILTEKVLARLRKEKNPRIISVSQNDAWGKMADNYCRCPNCRAIDEKDGSPAGSLLTAVNRIAEAVEKEFPDVLVETLAYQFTVKVPATVRPRKNVIIRYCTRKNALAPIDSEENARVRDEIRSWSRIANKIYIWDYVSNFGNTMMPYPSWRHSAENLRFFAENHVVSVLEQGYSAGEAGDLIPLQNYVLCKLMWNPDLDQEKLTREFLSGYYGAAAPEIRKYMRVSWEIYRKNQLRAQNESRQRNAFADLVGAALLQKLPLEDLLTLRAIFDRAEQLVRNDPEKSRRVAIAALAVNFPILFSDEADAWKAEEPSGHALRKQINLTELLEKTRAAVKSLRGKERYKEASEATLDRYLDAAEKYVTGNWNKGKKIPAQFASIPVRALRVYGPESFSIWNSKVTEENGCPLIRVGTKKGWKVHFSFDPSHHFGNAKWRVLIGLRTCFKGAHRGMTSCDVTSTHFKPRWIKIAEIAGDRFKYIDLGTHKLDGKHGYIALSPSGIDQELQMQYLILIREKAE